MKSKFIKQSVWLSVITIALRGISTIFIIYLSKKIGAEQVGIYQLACSVFFFFTALASSSLNVSVTRIVSQQLEKGNTYGVKQTLTLCINIAMILGVLSGVILFYGADFFGTVLLKEQRTSILLKILSLQLPMIAVGSVIRGYHIGCGEGVKSARIDVIEYTMNVIVTLSMLQVLSSPIISLGIGSVVSEMVALIVGLMSIKLGKVQGSRINGLGKQICGISVPLAISYYTRTMLSSVENALVPSGLVKYGKTKTDALVSYGEMKGVILPVMMFPASILFGFSSMLVPEVSKAVESGNNYRVSRITTRALRVAMVTGVTVCGVLLLFPTMEIVALAPLIPLMFVDQVVDAILKGLDQQVSSMKYNTIDAFLRAVLIFILIPIMGINGYIVMLYIGTMFNGYMSINRLMKVSQIYFDYRQWFVMPIVSMVIAVMLAKLSEVIVVQYVVYIVALMVVMSVTKSVNSTDYRWIYRTIRGQ